MYAKAIVAYNFQRNLQNVYSNDAHLSTVI
jgi:hypothetical protein